MMDRIRWKTSAETAPNCPRCASPNTKFCYYNNYSLSQPRYFCKGCRRYWTKGGSLRNVPVGGGCRKNRRSTKSGTGVSPASDRVSLPFCRTPMEVPHPPTTTSSNTTTTATDTPNIDLAAMFTKFLNQNQNSCFDPGLPAELPSHEYDQVNLEVHSPFSLTGFSSDLPSHESLDSLLPIQFPEEQVTHQDQSCTIPQFMDYDPNCYGLESILSDGLWSENFPSTAVSPNFSWQTSQITGLESVIPSPAEHLFACHPYVLLNDRWSSFDLSSSDP
ncbi:hypothetical protein NE237_018279 [Protea cynaroides]|uniref:Dof zinc finger protein n=1 Tax=Protea cynaroides TaxID=273540 RepID=A0A9Q0QNS6_9MAGN|nr:hypothetical protein NE237_018279 [Protea cynaroides]